MWDLVLLAAVTIGSFVLLQLIFRHPNPFILDLDDLRRFSKNDPDYLNDLVTEIEILETDAQSTFEFENVNSPMTPRVQEKVYTAEQLEKMEKKRKNVLAEFLSTEQTYGRRNLLF
jgi:hypothetical protein